MWCDSSNDVEILNLFEIDRICRIWFWNMMFNWSIKWIICNFFYGHSVFACPVPEGKSGQQVVDGLQKQVEMMGATKSGNFLVDCETYQSNPQNVTQTRMYMSYIFYVSEVIMVLHCLNMGLFMWTWDNLRRWSIASAYILAVILFMIFLL